MARSPALPLTLAQAENRLVRPQDYAGTYANPSREFARMAAAGVLIRVAYGYYAVPPERELGGSWRPPIEAVALGIAVADYGTDAAALIGPSAARLLGVLPRSLAAAAIAVAKQRPRLDTAFGRVQFVRRDVRALKLQRVDTVIVSGWTATAEQTILDLADRPTLAGITAATASEAMTQLASRADWPLVGQLARAQRKRAAYRRATWLAAAVRDVPELEAPPRPVPSLGLRPISEADAARYGVDGTK